ncbi:MAG: glycosyltransferase, partial [Limisphaerales bacterium]
MDLGVSGDPVNSYNHHCTMNKVLEYMAVGKPQVTFDLKESHYSAGEAAHYVSEVTSQALGQAIADLLDDQARREQMGQLGKARFRSELNWEKSVEQLEAAYAHTLGQA